MNINTEAMKNPNKRATKEFIENALEEIENDIIYVEQKHSTMLVGDRANFNNAHRDWIGLTQAQVVFATSLWRKGILDRYGITKK